MFTSILFRPTLLAACLFFAAVSSAEYATVKVDIPVSPLADAINSLAASSGSVITFDAALTQGKTAPALKGEYGVNDALYRLLQGSGLELVTESDGSYRIVQQVGQGPLMLAPIRVKGENIQRELIDTNTSVNVQTATDIMRSNDVRIGDAFSRAANIQLLGNSVQASNFVIRGVVSSGVGGAGDGAVAALTVDGAAYSVLQLSRGYNSLFDVDQVEVLRGPQNTGQARNSLAGAVVVTTKDPEFVQDTQSIVSAGNYGTYQLGVANTGPITDELAYRITLQRLSTDGFIENPVLGIDNYNYNESDTIRVKLLYQSESMPLQVMVGHAHIESAARNDTSSYFPERQEFINENPYGLGGMDSRQRVSNLRIRYELSDNWSLESLSVYSDFLSEDLNSNYVTLVPDRDQAWLATADQDEFNQTLKLDYDGDRARGVIGLFYFDETNTALRDGVALPGFGAFPGVGTLDLDAELNAPIETETWAIFGEVDIDLTDNFTLTLGGRYEELEFKSVSSGSGNLVLPPPAPYTLIVPEIFDLSADGSNDFNVFLPKAGITYALSDNQRVGFTYSEGYRQGGVSADFFTGVVDPFEPEYVKNYEISYKGQFNNGFSLNANLFYLDWTEQQVAEEVAPDISLTRNAGESRIYGGELELVWRTAEWDTYASFGYANTKFDRFVTGSTDFSGNEFPSSPRVTAAAGAFYTYERWTVGVEANYRSGYYPTSANLNKTEALTLVDLSAAYRFNDVTVRGFVNNVFDAVELDGQVFNIASETTGDSIPLSLFSDPLTFGVQVMYGF